VRWEVLKLASEMDLAVEVIKAVSVEAYKDTVKPLAIEVGKALQTGGKVLNLMLSPVRGMVWSYETITDTLEPIMREKIQRIAADKLKHPEPNIAVPAMEALRYSLGSDEIREMFANLLATSMNVDTLKFAHPGFVEIIKQMSPLDARIFQDMTNTSVPDNLRLAIAIIRNEKNNARGNGTDFKTEFMTFQTVPFDMELNPPSIINLERLGLIKIEYMRSFQATGSYDHLENHPYFLSYKKIIIEAPDAKDFTPVLQKGIVKITPFGENFKKACYEN
jgi:hypothetical protein